MRKTRICPVCGKKYPLNTSHFYKSDRSTDGFVRCCKKCMSEKARKRYKEKKEKERLIAKTLKRRHKLLLEKYDDLLEQQNNRCAICGALQDELEYRMCVDHNHKTGEVRGLLCNKCNLGLGNFKDSCDLLKKAEEYLKKYR